MPRPEIPELSERQRNEIKRVRMLKDLSALGLKKGQVTDRQAALALIWIATGLAEGVNDGAET